MGIVGYSFCHIGCNIYDLESKDPIYSFNLIVDALHKYLDNDAYDELMHAICRTICAKIMGISIDEYNEICDKYGIDGREPADDDFDDDFDEDDDSVDLDGDDVDLSFFDDFVDADEYGNIIDNDEDDGE